MAKQVKDRKSLQERVEERQEEIRILCDEIKHGDIAPDDYKNALIRLRFLRNSHRILKGKLCRREKENDFTPG
jgi:hypothetical protein